MLFRSEVQGLAFNLLRSKRNQFCLHPVLVELSLEPEPHFLHILATLWFSTDTVYASPCELVARSALSEDAPWNSYCLREAFDEGFNVSIDIIEKLFRCRHSRGYCLRVKTKEDTTRTSLKAVPVTG